MSIAAGYKTKTAIRKEGPQIAYGTPVQCGADHQVPIIPPVGLSREIIKEPDNCIRHKAGIGGSSILQKNARGPIECQMVYRGLEHLLICACGFSNAPATIATGVYKHTFELAENLHTEPITAGSGILAGDGALAGDSLTRRATVCIDKNVSIWEHISCMVQSMTIRGSAKKVSVEFDLIAYNLDRNSPVNTSSASWNIPNTDWDAILFQDLIFWINDYSGSTPLDSNDAVGVSEFELKLENNLKITQDSQSGLYIAEPRRDGKRLVTGSFTFPRYESNDFLNKFDNQSPMMAILKFTGPQIGSTGYYYTFWIFLPTIKFDDVDAPLEGANLLPVKHQFSAELPAAVPAGFPASASKELLLQVQNNFATNPMFM